MQVENPVSVSLRDFFIHLLFVVAAERCLELKHCQAKDNRNGTKGLYVGERLAHINNLRFFFFFGSYEFESNNETNKGVLFILKLDHFSHKYCSSFRITYDLIAKSNFLARFAFAITYSRIYEVVF